MNGCKPSTVIILSFFFQAEDGIRDVAVTGVQTCALPIYQILDGAREHVMDAWASIGRRRALVKHERRSVAGGFLRLLEQALVLPRREELLLQLVGRKLGVEQRVGHQLRSEERRVGKEGRSRWSPY